MPNTRREFLGLALRGAGFTIGLPMLHSVLPRAARAATSSPKRLLVFYMPNGRNKETWQPTQTGSTYALPSAMAPLLPLQSQMTVLSGLVNQAGLDSTGTGDHAKATTTVTTGVPHMYGRVNALTMDQLLTQRLNPPTRIASLQWGCGQPNVCDVGAFCADTQALSWSGANTPLPPICEAQTAFTQLFGSDDVGLSSQQRQSLRLSRRSMLDFVLLDANSLRLKASSADAQKLDEYLTGVRALEQQLDSATSPSCKPGSVPATMLSYQEQVSAFSDLMVLALQCDQTRVITFMAEFGLSSRTHPFLNAPLGHHSLSHYGSADELAQLIRVETWQVQQAANLALKLSQTTEADGKSLLDNTAMLVLPGMGQGALHDHSELCVALLGGAGGALHPGQHRNFDKKVPVANLHVALLQALDVDVPNFGTSSTGRIDML